MTTDAQGSIVAGPDSRPATPGGRVLADRLPWIRLSLVSLLFILHLAVTVFVTQPGHLSIDEGIYHQMARAFAQSGSLSVWNGYEEFPSSELRHPIHAVRDGTLYPQYPYLTAIAAWPFYTAMGYRGLFVMNAVAYVAVALLCFATTRRIFGDARLALDSVAILTLASFAWQYSQEAWPHTLSLMFIAAAVYCTVRGLSRDSSGSDAGWAFAAGAALGIGAGARLDVVFALPAIVLPHLFLTPMRPRAALSALAGLIPGFAALAATNYVKFGVPSPFSYGGAKAGAGELIHYLPVPACGLLVTIGLWAVTRPGIRVWLRARPVGVAVATAVALIGLWLVPPIAAATQQLGAGAVRLIVDFRLYDAAWIEPGMSLTPGGAVVYFGGLKKALLQSMPWLPLLALPIAAFARANQPHRILGMLFLLVAAYLAFYSYYAWHGGLVLNLRYFLPALVPFAILGAWALRELARKAPPATLVPAIVAAPAAFVVATYLVYRNPEPAAAEGPLLTVPLTVAGLLAILLVCRAVATGSTRRAMAGAAVLCAATAMGWGSASTIAYDVPMSAARRALHTERARVVAPFLTPDSILFVLHETPYFGLYELDRVRIAATNRDDFEGFRPLLEHHLAAGRPVYLALGDKAMAIAHERGLLDGLSLHALSEQVSRVDAAPDLQKISGEPQ